MPHRNELIYTLCAVGAVIVGMIGLGLVVLLRQPGPFPHPFVRSSTTVTSTARAWDTTTSSTSRSQRTAAA